MLKNISQEICKLNVKWGDNIRELVNKCDEIESIASSEIIYFKRCNYLHDIRDPEGKYCVHGFSMIRIQLMLQLFIVTKCGNIRVAHSLIKVVNQEFELFAQNSY